MLIFGCISRGVERNQIGTRLEWRVMVADASKECYKNSTPTPRSKPRWSRSPRRATRGIPKLNSILRGSILE